MTAETEKIIRLFFYALIAFFLIKTVFEIYYIRKETKVKIENLKLSNELLELQIKKAR